MNPVQFFKCLSDETRLRCMLLIQREVELCVCELTEALEEIQPKVSRHLAQLRNCKLLEDRRQGQWIYYRIDPSLPEWAQSILTSVSEANSHYLHADLERLSAMGNRPERIQRACC